MSEPGAAAPKTITIRQGDEYRAKEGSIYIANDIFHENFSEAARILGEILRHSDCYLEDLDKKVIDFSQIDSGSLLGYPNNIIAFCAERGHGKTSAMVTFAKALQNLSEKGDEEKGSFWDTVLEKAKENGSKGTKEQGLAWMEKHSFHILTRIDPTTMGKNDSILRVMLVRMYSDFIDFAQKEERHKPWSGNRQDIDQLQEDFQKCLRIIRQMMSEKIFDEDVDDLEQIWNQQDVTNLCWQLYRLIREYLAFRTGSKNGVLVLQIDDVDLSTGRAHRILEDIRRYLFVPQVVVLLAVDMSQLEGAVEQNFIKEFSDSLRNHGIVGLDDCHDMMERYLDKLLPSTKQVHLVNVNDEIKRSYHGLQIRYLHRDAMDNEDETTANLLIKYLDLEKDDPKLKWSYQEQLLHLLYRKTGMVFLAPEYLHNLLPRTMRELTHFLAYFYPMSNFVDDKDIVIKGNGYEKMLDDEKAVPQRLHWGENIARFKHYLLHAWACINLQESERAFLLKLDKTADVNKNLMVLKFLPEYYGTVMGSGNVVREISTKKAEEYRKEFCDACEAHDIYLNEHLNREWATYANVCEALNILSETPGSSRFYSLIYAVHLYYSIRLHELMLSEKPLRQRWQDVQVIMGSTLFNPHRLPEGSIFGQMNSFEIRVGDLRTVIEQTRNGNNVSLWNQITAWCREIVPGSGGAGKYSYRVLAEFGKLKPRDSKTTDDEKLGDDQLLSFDIFTPLFHEFETITLSDISDERTNLASALSILLNWDVQYCIQRNLKEQKTSLLRPYVKNVYKSIQSGTDNGPPLGVRFASADYIPSLLRNAPIPNIEVFLSDETADFLSVETADVLFWSGKSSICISVLRKIRNQASKGTEAWKADLIRYGDTLKRFLSPEEYEELENLSKDNSFDKVFGSPESPNSLADIRKKLQTLSKKCAANAKQAPASSKATASSQEDPLSSNDSSNQNESST